MNEQFEEKICSYFNTLLDTIPYKKRNKEKLVLVESYLPKIKGTYLQESVYSLIGILEIKYMIFGEWGECGLVIFLDYNLKEIVRLAYEDSNSTRSWFVKE